jgi:hypothetical protein
MSRAMPLARLIRFLTLFALLLAPLGMMGSHAAAAMPMPHGASHAAPVTPDHCAPAKDDDGDRARQSIDCTIFCAAMAAPDAAVSGRTAFAGPALAIRPVPFGQGLNPESEPPPPRIS